MVSDEEIDSFLFMDFGPGSSVEHIMGFRKIEGDCKEIYNALLASRLFEPDFASHSNDSLRLSTFGRTVKNAGGWVSYLKAQKLKEERERLEMSQLRVNIFQVKYWWLILLISGLISAILSIGLPLILKLLRVE